MVVRHAPADTAALHTTGVSKQSVSASVNHHGSTPTDKVGSHVASTGPAVQNRRAERGIAGCRWQRVGDAPCALPHGQ